MLPSMTNIIFSTPWLTTRRRTCPICKGDVVRSLARSSYTNAVSGSSPSQQYYHDISEEEEEDGEGEERAEEGEREEDVQEQAALGASQPVSREEEAFEDLERGVGGVDRTR